MKMTGAQVMVKCLEEEGISVIFGYPGGAILPFYDVLRDTKDIRHILTAHEQGAAHAADGYARASGKVGVCCATSGPGATNLVTGLANAFLDSVPLVAITGQVKSSMIGHDAFQEVDITGIAMPITKQTFLVTKPEELEQTMRLAFLIARSGRPGPVLVDVANDVQTALIDYEPSPKKEMPITIPDKGLIEKAIAAINGARRPVMLVGGGRGYFGHGKGSPPSGGKTGYPRSQHSYGTWLHQCIPQRISGHERPPRPHPGKPGPGIGGCNSGPGDPVQ
jgi:acetolactate synthase-1/2/3 large subunit